jgi:hypothetical protein
VISFITLQFQTGKKIIIPIILKPFCICRAGRQLQCQRIFQVPAPVNAVVLHPDQTQIMVGDQSGIIHMWDLRTDKNDQLVRL